MLRHGPDAIIGVTNASNMAIFIAIVNDKSNVYNDKTIVDDGTG
jgi:hypothetical protein